MELALEGRTDCRVRSWRESDVESLAKHANDRRVWLNLRDAFPHPYSIEDAKKFVAKARSGEPETLFAIEVDGEAAGGIGFMPHSDVERLSAEIGYWVAPKCWGRGIATAAVRALSDRLIATLGLVRIFALPFAWNPASCRVLEKAGFVLEGRMRKSAIKDGKVVDQWLYAKVVPD